MKYKVITIILVAMFLSTGFAIACVKAQEPTPTFEICDNNDCVFPSVVPSEEPTASSTASESATPTGEVQAATSQGGDGKSQGSDGLHTAGDGLGCSAHECKAIPDVPNAGRGN